jgi:branched-chain amino acid transport system permease protein
VITTAWAGLAVGSIYVLTALGYNLVFVTTGVFNFAQAQFMMVGTFIAYWTAVELRVPVILGFVLGAAIGFTLGAVEERVAIRPVMGRRGHGELVTTVGVGVALDGLAAVLWGNSPLAVPFFGSQTSLNLFGGQVLPVEVTLIVAALVIPGAIALWKRFSLTGITSMAVAEDRRSAILRGINVPRFSLVAVASAAALAGMLGPITAPKTFAVYNLGDSLAIYSFVALAIGGYGSVIGSVIGGFVVGLASVESARYMGAPYADIMVFGILVVVLLWRPTGIFGAKAGRVV